MMTARPPTPMIGPIDRYLLYPRRIISGTISEPSSAQAPMLEPAGPANAVPPISVTYASRPRTLPSSLSAALKHFVASPVW